MTGTMDAWIAAATDAIVEERRRVDLAEQVRIRSVIESLVGAEPVDLEAASQLLRIPLEGWHLGCAIGYPRIAPAAELLFLHRNTSINRLERVQALLGHGRI